MDLDGRRESAHATRIFVPQLPRGGHRNAEITIPHCPFTTLIGDSSPQSGCTRHFRSDLYRC